MSSTTNVGSVVYRTEDPALLTGKGRYVDDISMPGMLEVAFVRSSEAHARIKGVDKSEALKIPGVVAVLTIEDFPEFEKKQMVQANPHPAMKQNITQKPLSGVEVCYVGETIAMVVAENRYIAEDGAQAVIVDYEPLPVVIDVLQASKPDAPRVHEGAPDNIVARLEWKIGDVNVAFAGAPHVFKESYTQHRGGCHSMECRGVVATFSRPRP